MNLGISAAAPQLLLLIEDGRAFFEQNEGCSNGGCFSCGRRQLVNRMGQEGIAVQWIATNQELQGLNGGAGLVSLMMLDLGGESSVLEVYRTIRDKYPETGFLVLSANPERIVDLIRDDAHCAGIYRDLAQVERAVIEQLVAMTQVQPRSTSEDVSTHECDCLSSIDLSIQLATIEAGLMPRSLNPFETTYG